MIFCVLTRAVFYLLLLCCTCGFVHGENAETFEKKNIVLYVEKKQIGNVYNSEKTYEYFRYCKLPLFDTADGVIVTICTRNIVGNGTWGEGVDILGKYIDTESDEWENNLIDGSDSKWNITHYLPNTENKNSVLAREFLSAVVDNTVYLLSINYGLKTTDSLTVSKFDFELFVGDVVGGKGNRTVNWRPPVLLQDPGFFEPLSKISVVEYRGFSGQHSLVTSDGNIFFVLRVTHGTNYSTALLHLKDVGSKGNKKLEWIYLATPEDCYSNNSIFLWEDKLIMVAHCDGNNTHTVRESSDMGRTWKNSNGPFSVLYDNLKGKVNLATMTINNKSVLTFMERGETVVENEGEEKVRLWMTDGNQIQDMGVIFDGYKLSASKLLQVSGELYFMSEEYKEDESQYVTLTHLKKELKKAHNVLSDWNKISDAFSQLCDDNTTSSNAWLTQLPKVGLIGVLSVADENISSSAGHGHVKPEVKGGTKIKNGFKLSGRGAGATWKVSDSLKKNMESNFARKGLSFVASVNIDFFSRNGDSSLMGVGMSDFSRVGLRCSRDGKWLLDSGEERTTILTGEKCEVNKTYQLALTLHDGTIAAYVDWEPLKGVDKKSMRMVRHETISHFYVGADRGQGVTDGNMTVTNVLLYNRPFEKNEIDHLRNNRLISLSLWNGTQKAITAGTTRRDSALSDTNGFITFWRFNSLRFGGVQLLPVLIPGLCGVLVLFF